jgi:Mg-chelatase subunit ChlD
MRRAIACSWFIAMTAVAIAAPAKKPHEHGTFVVLLDRSGSMQGPRWEFAKEATKAAIAALDPSDDVAVITFDSEAMIVVKVQPAGKFAPQTLAKLQAGGGTNYLPALELAHKTLAKLKGKKHVVLLTDGQAPSDGIAERLEKMHDDAITLTTIGIGDGADRNLLMQMADAGNGRLWMVDDPSSLPKIFVKEVETALPR